MLSYYSLRCDLPMAFFDVTVVNGKVVISGTGSGSSLSTSGSGGNIGFCEVMATWFFVVELVVFEGGVTVGFGGGGGGLAEVLTVLHMGGCEVINQGGLGLLVVVVVAAVKKEVSDYYIFKNFFFVD